MVLGEGKKFKKRSQPTKTIPIHPWQSGPNQKQRRRFIFWDTSNFFPSKQEEKEKVKHITTIASAPPDIRYFLVEFCSFRFLTCFPFVEQHLNTWYLNVDNEKDNPQHHFILSFPTKIYLPHWVWKQDFAHDIGVWKATNRTWLIKTKIGATCW